MRENEAAEKDLLAQAVKVDREEAQALREEIGAVGERVLGPLNSRPKALVHVSAMRLLDWPAEAALDVGEHAHVTAVLRSWTSALAADRLPTGEAAPQIGAAVHIASLELVRDVHWMMTHRRTYRRFLLG